MSASSVVPADSGINTVKGRIGIFEYDWAMYGLVKDFAVKLADSGYLVDIFHKDEDLRDNFAEMRELEHHMGIRYYSFTSRETQVQVLQRRLKRMRNRLALSLGIRINDGPNAIIAPEILSSSKELVTQAQYLCFVGIEKKGLVWAGLLAPLHSTPLIYYSLELYLEDHPQLDRFYHLRHAEREYHQISCATIVQDEARAKALLKGNGVAHTNLLYFPVSVRGNPVRQKSRFLRNKLHIAGHKKILLYFGIIQESRYLTEIVRMATHLDNELLLVCHGPASRRYLAHLQSIANKDKVAFSLDFIGENEITELVSSAHIGLAFYAATNANDRLAAFSSTKLAYYAQCGVPVVALESESLRTLMRAYAWGELVSSVNDVPQAARKILDRYDQYQSQAYLAFEQFYNCDSNFSRLLPQLEEAFNAAALTRPENEPS